MIKFLVATAWALGPASAALAAAQPAPPGRAQAAAPPGTPQPAGSTDGTSATPRADAGISELVVTATRREIALQRLPDAVTAISSQRLDELNAQTFQDYFRTAPGLMYNSLGPGLNRFDFTIRGVSNFSQLIPIENATVGQYLDEIPVTAVGQQVDPRLVDVERIEILRGPQGTYFGEDSLSGTIRIITKKPSFAGYSALAEARVSWTEGGGPNEQVSAVVNAPVLDGVLAFRGNAFVARDSGFVDGVKGGCQASGCTVDSVEQRNLNPGRDYGLRGLVLWQPADRISVLGEAVHSRSHERNAALYEPRVGDLQIIAVDTNAGTGPTGPPGGNGGPPGGGQNGGSQNGGGPGGFGPSGDVSGLDVVDVSSLYSLTGRFTLPAAEVVSTSSLGRRHLDTGTPGSDDDLVMRYRDFAQEVRLQSGTSPDDGWDYTAGVYYQRHRKDAVQPVASSTSVISERVTDQAVFGDLGWRLGRLSIRGGLRQQLVTFHRASKAPSATAATESSGHNAATTGRFVVSYDLDQSALIYVSASRGFRRGGLNAPFPGVPTAYRPDHTTDYEVGWKLTASSGRLFLNGDVFSILWDDIQVAQLAASGPAQQQYYANGGAARIDGLELEGGALLFEGLKTQFSLAWLNPQLTKDQPGAACGRGCPGRKGDQIPYVSRSTASLSLDYKRRWGASPWETFADLSEQFSGPRNTDFSPTAPDGAPNLVFRRIRSSWLTNLQLGVASPSWRISLFVDNLLDRRNPYSVTPSFGMSGGNGDQVLVDRPRTVGLWLRRGF